RHRPPAPPAFPYTTLFRSVDAAYMTELNHRWMDGEGPTDVLAFPMDESSVDHGPGEAGGEPALLGDIVLCPEVAAKQAAGAGHRSEEHTSELQSQSNIVCR